MFQAIWSAWYSFLAARTDLKQELETWRGAVRLGRVGIDFHWRSSRRRIFLIILRAGVNQGFALDEWMVFVMTGACLSRIEERVEL